VTPELRVDRDRSDSYKPPSESYGVKIREWLTIDRFKKIAGSAKVVLVVRVRGYELLDGEPLPPRVVPERQIHSLILQRHDSNAAHLSKSLLTGSYILMKHRLRTNPQRRHLVVIQGAVHLHRLTCL
jgi:hypothetical protein